MQETVNVRMLGGLSVRMGENSVDDGTGRMRKVWLLLAYLLHTRNTRVNQQRLLDLLGTEDGIDATGRLKAMLYRVRNLLDRLGDGAGHRLILFKGGCYYWNPDVAVTLDTEEFERLLTSAACAEEEERLRLCLEAIELYRGDFLPKLSMESWVMPISAYYHEMYLQAAEQALTILEKRQDWQQGAAVCIAALKVEHYSESLFQHLMRCRIALGDRSGAVRDYEEMSELLFATFGVMPSEESRKLYREALREAENVFVPVGTVREQLREPSAARGAMFCEYDFFKMLYQAQARAISRSGDTVHIALLSLVGKQKRELPRCSLDTAMENLQELVLMNLRQGDIVTRCSVSQFIVMLQGANYENSGMVCQRIQRAFIRQYPHSPAEIHFSVQPLEPMIPGKRAEGSALL